TCGTETVGRARTRRSGLGSLGSVGPGGSIHGPGPGCPRPRGWRARRGIPYLNDPSGADSVRGRFGNGSERVLPGAGKHGKVGRRDDGNGVGRGPRGGGG